MIAYLIGGPHDLSKREILYEVASLQFPTTELRHRQVGLPIDPTAKPHMLMSHYRRFHHELDEQFSLFYYEGTW